MIAFTIGMIAVITILYSVYQMKKLVGSDKNESKLRHLIAGPNDVAVIPKFIRKMNKNKDRDLRKQYFKILFFFIIGIFLFFSLILYEIIYG